MSVSESRIDRSGVTVINRFERQPYFRHTLAVALIAVMGTMGISIANKRFAPEMYSSNGPVEIADALASGKNYGLFDLNINIREIRDAQIARMAAAPEIVVLGASHWQEAGADLIPDTSFYNAHVHRDYYEDLLAVSGMFVRHKKVPRTMVIALRDNLFTPIEDRKDHLWLPGIPYYRDMAKEIGIEQHGPWAALPVARWREQISVPMLFENLTRWYNSDERPHATDQRYFKSLDTLTPAGSIVWSREHRALFTEKRSKALSVASAAANAERPPQLDPKGIEAVDALLGYLRSNGVEVALALPPFNPIYFDRVRDTQYMHGLRRVDAVVRQLAEKHALRVIGSFDPVEVGCTEDMFIDSEHSNHQCLSKVFDQLSPGVPDSKPLIVSEATWVVADHIEGSQASRLKQPMTSRDLASQQRKIAENSRGPHGLVEVENRDPPRSSRVPAPTRMLSSAQPDAAGAHRGRDIADGSQAISARRNSDVSATGQKRGQAHVQARQQRRMAEEAPRLRRHRLQQLVVTELTWPGDPVTVTRRRPGSAVPRNVLQ